MLPEGDDSHNASHHVQKKRSEVTDEGHHYQALWNPGSQIVSEDAEAVPEIVRQSFDDIILESGGTAKVEDDGSNCSEARNNCQFQNGPVRCQPFAGKHCGVF